MDPQPPVAPPVPPVEQPVEQPEAKIGVPAPGLRNPADFRAAAREQMIWNLVYLFVGVVVIGTVFAILRAWMRRQTQAECSTTSLSSFREMYENGELTESEYQKIRAKMAGKMKKELGLRKPTVEEPIDLQQAPPPNGQMTPKPPAPPTWQDPAAPPTWPTSQDPGDPTSPRPDGPTT